MEITLQHLIIGVTLAISGLFDYAYFVYYFQLKEYRLDKFRDFLSTDSGKRFLFEYRILWRAVVVAALYSLVGMTWTATTLMIIILLLEILSKGFHVWKRHIRRPVPTAKAVLIVLLALMIETAVFWFGELLNVTLLLLVFRVVIVGVLALLVNIPSHLAKYVFILLATKKMLKYKDLRVIGITGSYGKSSTKEYLAQILAAKYTVIKTPKNINTEIGVAKFILSQDFSKADVFVVEMGAYTMGEIKKICDIVHPSVGILTAIAPQHLSLFGSIKNIQKAKYELLHALPESGLAITNVDNDYCRELLHTLSTPVRTFGSDEEFNPDVRIEDVKNTKEGIAYRITYDDGDTRSVALPIIGKHNAFNIIAAAIAAKFVGMSREEIDRTIETLQPGHGTIKIEHYGTAIIINDSYNSNPEGFKAALDVLNTFPSDMRRIVITRGMLELGERSQELHEQIGGEISFVADELVIIKPDSAKDLAHGVVHKYKTDVHYLYDPRVLVEYLKGIKDKNVVILLENRMPSAVYKELKI